MGACNPQVVDFNGDGIKDLMVGERDGYVNFFERKADMTLKAKVRLKANGGDVKVRQNSSPFLADWNGDGLLDLFLGCDASDTGGIRLYLNSGKITSYKYTTFSKLKAGDVTLSYRRAQVKVLDLNKDGKKDFLFGIGNGTSPTSIKETRIYFCENTGSNSSPVLKKPVALMTKNGKPVYPEMGHDITYDIADWNDDGAWDVIVGDYEGNKIKLFLGIPTTSVVTASAAKEQNFSYGWNATRNIFSIEYNPENAQTITFDLYSAMGKRVFHRKENTGPHVKYSCAYTLESFAAGIYLMRCTYFDRAQHERIFQFSLKMSRN